MEAIVIKTVDGIKVFVNDKTENFTLYCKNLGGIERANHWFFWSNDAVYVPEMLTEEGYSVVRKKQF